jgi:hypothetical protein
MEVSYGNMKWNGDIFAFSVSMRKKNYDYLLEFETSRHWLTIYLFSDYSKPQRLIKFLDRILYKVIESKYAKDQKRLKKIKDEFK